MCINPGKCPQGFCHLAIYSVIAYIRYLLRCKSFCGFFCVWFLCLVFGFRGFFGHTMRYAGS